MSHTSLPAADQPDPYTGTWTRTRIYRVSPDSHQGIYHLGVEDGSTGSYCTTFNPRAWCDLHMPRNRRQSVTVGHIIRGQVPTALNDQLLDPCPRCLTMARVQAEMAGQRYPVQRLLDALDRLPAPPTSAHPR